MKNDPNGAGNMRPLRVPDRGGYVPNAVSGPSVPFEGHRLVPEEPGGQGRVVGSLRTLQCRRRTRACRTWCRLGSGDEADAGEDDAAYHMC